jgi:Ca2+/Na+ antiporter
MNNKIYQFLFYVICAVVLILIFTSQKKEKQLNEQIAQIESQNYFLQESITQLNHKADSLTIAIDSIKVNSSSQIKTQIITKYEQEYKHISNLNANQHFEYFSKWLSEID